MNPLLMWPGGPPFAELDRPIIANDEAMRAEFRANPDLAAVEFGGQWRTSLDHYLEPALIQGMFGPYQGALLPMKPERRHDRRYFAHCDPSTSGANFGIAVAHGEMDGQGINHVVFDYLHAYRPMDFPDGRIDYATIREDLKDLISVYMPERLTFDLHNSELLITDLTDFVRGARLWGGVKIYARPESASQNLEDAERFKTLLGSGQLHAPFHPLARDELTYLQFRNGRVDHPRHGPVQTDDITNAMFAVTAHLTQGALGRDRLLSETQLHAMPFAPLTAADRNTFDAFEGFGRGRRNRIDRRNATNPARGNYRLRRT